MGFTRECAPAGEEVSLRVIFTDNCGNPVDPDTDGGLPPSYLVELYIYDEEVDSDTVAAAIEAMDFSGATYTVDPDDIDKISTGYFEYAWTVPDDADEGAWHDVWVATIRGVEGAKSFQIDVVEGGEVGLQEIGENELIVIELDETIADEDGNTLEEDTTLHFTTLFNPYYASPDLVRLECGTWLNGIPDSTIALMIHWSSITSDSYIGASNKRSPNYEVARTKFVIFDAALRLLFLPVDLGGGAKRLGDLMIDRDNNFEEIIDDLKALREEWAQVVNAGGNIVPGQSLAPISAQKSFYDPDRSFTGRGWASRVNWTYLQPSVNARTPLTVYNRRYSRVFQSMN